VERTGHPDVHTLGLVKREVMDEDIDGESDIRIEIERDAVKKSAPLSRRARSSSASSAASIAPTHRASR